MRDIDNKATGHTITTGHLLGMVAVTGVMMAPLAIWYANPDSLLSPLQPREVAATVEALRAVPGHETIMTIDARPPIKVQVADQWFADIRDSKGEVRTLAISQNAFDCLGNNAPVVVRIKPTLYSPTDNLELVTLTEGGCPVSN